MKAVQAVPSIQIKNILYLTDFSAASEHVLPFAIGLARKYHATIEALHVLTPVIPDTCSAAIQADTGLAEFEMKKIETKLVGVPFETTLARGMGMWEAVERAIRDNHIDVIVLATHGRTGVSKFLLGSVAEEVFRRSPVPVMTIGPAVRNAGATAAKFHHVLFATDFSSESEAAAPFAISLADESPARLKLLHVMPEPTLENPSEINRFEASVANAIRRLREIVPSDAEIYNPAEVVIEYGDPADRIVSAARERGADLIVLGVRGAAVHLGAATHLGQAVAHQVVAHAPCPVLTVRALETTSVAHENNAGERTFP